VPGPGFGGLCGSEFRRGEAVTAIRTRGLKRDFTRQIDDPRYLRARTAVRAASGDFGASCVAATRSPPLTGDILATRESSDQNCSMSLAGRHA